MVCPLFYLTCDEVRWMTRSSLFIGTSMGFTWGCHHFTTSKAPLTDLVLDTFYGFTLGFFWPITFFFGALSYGDYLILQRRDKLL